MATHSSPTNEIQLAPGTVPAIGDTVKFGRKVFTVVYLEVAGPGLSAATKGRITHCVGFEHRLGATYLGDVDVAGVMRKGSFL